MHPIDFDNRMNRFRKHKQQWPNHHNRQCFATHNTLNQLLLVLVLVLELEIGRAHV